MTITFTGAASTAPQNPIVLTCSTASELAANPAAITAFTATAVSSTDATPSVAATYNSVTAMTAIDGDVDETSINLTPSKIVLKATATTAIGNGGTITFTAGGAQNSIWVAGRAPACTGTEAGGAIATAITASTTSANSITITIHATEGVATGAVLVFTCSGDLAANFGTAATATTFTATSSGDAQQVAFGAGYVTTAAQQGALGVVVTQVSTVGADGTKPVSIVYTWTPDTSTVLAPTTITLTHTGATPWNANGAVTCTKSGTNAATLAVGAAVVSDSGAALTKDQITFTVASATSGASQAAIVFTCSTTSEFAAQPAAVTTISATGVSSVDVTPSVAATYSSVTAMTAIDGDVDETSINLTPSKIVLKATTTTAITTDSNTVVFTANGAVWTDAANPTCTGKKGGAALTLATTSSLTSNSGQTITITLGTGVGAQTAALVALEFECTGNLVANSGTANTATTFAATSSVDAQQVAFGAGYVTTAAQQGALAIAVTQVSTVGTDGTKPVSIVYTWTPDTSTVLAPTTITLTHTGATPWAGATATCAISGSNAATLTTSAVSNSGGGLNSNDQITFTVASATSGASQAAIVFTCSTTSEFAAQPAAVTVISTTGVSSVDVTPSVAATYSSVTAMTAIDGDVDETTIGLTPSKIVLKATTTTAIGNSGTITFTAGGTQSAIWTNGQTPTCTGTDAGSVITTALISSTTSTSSITITIHSSETIAAGAALVFTCSGDLVANHGTATTATTFTATSTSDAQQVAFGAGYVTTAAQQGALAIAVTQVSAVGTDGTKPVSIVYTWTPDTSTVLAPTTITLTHTGATPWAGATATCAISGNNAATLTTSAVSNSGGGLNSNDQITFTVASATSGASQAAIVFTCSTTSEFAAQPAAVTTISATGVSSVDVTPSVAATYSSVTAMTAIDGDVDETSINLTPSKIVLKATTTTAITTDSNTVVFTANGAVWTDAANPTCTGKKGGAALTLATTSSLTSNSGQTITITLGTGAGAQTAALVALEFECTGNLVANSGTANTATTFAATSSVDAQQVAFGAGYVTTAAQQGALAIAVTQVSTVGADGTKPVSIVYTWTPDTSTVLAPTTITLTHTGATPWNANGAVTCTKSGANAATLTTSVVSDSGAGLNSLTTESRSRLRLRRPVRARQQSSSHAARPRSLQRSLQ